MFFTKYFKRQQDSNKKDPNKASMPEFRVYLEELLGVLNYEGFCAREKELFLDDFPINDALMAW